jgi:DNA-binding CsgD family transcriptional regulator/type II secretory pathway predicted ATPase ExeA
MHRSYGRPGGSGIRDGTGFLYLDETQPSRSCPSDEPQQRSKDSRCRRRAFRLVTTPLYCPRFIGRERELEALLDAARRAAAGAGAIAFVSGEAGAGKTRTVDELCRRLPRGTRCLRAASLEYAPSPLGPVTEILAALEIAVAPDGDDPLDKRRLFERIAAALRTAAAERPFVAVIDDAHWADTVTLELLQFLIGALHDARVLLVVAYRGDEVSEPLGALLARAARARNVLRIELQPLSNAEIRELIDATVPKHVRIAAESLRGIRDRSEGNPLYAEEFLKAVVDDERFGEMRQALPASLHGLLHERLRRLDRADVRLLEIAALIGRRFSAAFLARIGERDVGSLERFLRLAVDEHFLIEDAREPGCFTFRHGLTRDAILEGILEMQARAMHLEIARQIEREPDRAERVGELAEHYWRAAAFAECALNAEPAGDLARGRYAYAEAAELYERALACAASDESGLVALHEKAALAYGALGMPQKALEHLQVAVDYFTATGKTKLLVEALLEVALTLRRAGDTEHEAAVLRRAAALSRKAGDDALLLKCIVLLAHGHAVAEDWAEVEADLRAAEPLLVHADPQDEVRMLSSRGFLHLAKDELDAWQRDFEDAAGIARLNDDPRGLTFVLTSYAVGARKLARFAVARDAFREAAETGRAYGLTYIDAFARLGHANVLYLTGELRASRAEMLEVLADEHESTTVRILIAQFGIALAIALRDDALAERCSAPDLLEAAFATNEPIQYAPLAAAMAERELARGDEEAAVALLERVLDALPEGWSDCEVLLPVAVCCSEPSVERARARLAAASAAARNPFADAYRELFEAYAAARFGSREAKVRRAKSAAALLRQLGMPLLEAEAYELAEQPGRAIALCETIGALRLPRRIGPRLKRRSPTTQLTAREREIVGVVLRGLPNSAIADELSLSERTVEAHLAAAYRKLGVRSRGELISLMRTTDWSS